MSVILYKTSQGVYQRRPTADVDYLKFSIPLGPPKDQVKRISNAKQFLKNLITATSDLNFVKNEVGFAVASLFPNEVISKAKVEDLGSSSVLYVWTSFPFAVDNNVECAPLYGKIATHDICYINGPLTSNETLKILTFFKSEGLPVNIRRVNQKVALPISVELQGVKVTRLVTDNSSSAVNEGSTKRIRGEKNSKVIGNVENQLDQQSQHSKKDGDKKRGRLFGWF